MQTLRHLALVVIFISMVLVPDSLARPFTQGQQRRSVRSRVDRRDVNQFPDGIPTSSSNDDFSIIPCKKMKTETFADGTYNRTVEVCCDGYYGDNCDKKEPESAEAGSGEEKPAWDAIDPCKNLQCQGVQDAQCLTISKCGERWPVFLLPDGTLAPCANGQPVNVTRLTCSQRCTTDPCAGQTCSAFPGAICVHTACDCNEPMWLLDTGVQVDCETGEQLSPEEAKERKRRRKRQAANAPPASTSSCT